MFPLLGIYIIWNCINTSIYLKPKLMKLDTVLHCFCILKDFKNASLDLLLLTLRIHDILAKNIFELKSTSSLLNFDAKTEASTPVINVIHDEFKRHPEFNKTKVLGWQIFIRYNMISGNKHQKSGKCCWFAFIRN